MRTASPFPAPLRATVAEDRVVLVRFDRVYGLVKCYPANATANCLCALTGTKTLSPDNLKVARAMGFEVLVEHQSWSVLEAFLGGGS